MQPPHKMVSELMVPKVTLPMSNTGCHSRLLPPHLSQPAHRVPEGIARAAFISTPLSSQDLLGTHVHALWTPGGPRHKGGIPDDRGPSGTQEFQKLLETASRPGVRGSKAPACLQAETNNGQQRDGEGGQGLAQVEWGAWQAKPTSWNRLGASRGSRAHSTKAVGLGSHSAPSGHLHPPGRLCQTVTWQGPAQATQQSLSRHPSWGLCVTAQLGTATRHWSPLRQPPQGVQSRKRGSAKVRPPAPPPEWSGPAHPTPQPQTAPHVFQGPQTWDPRELRSIY